MFDHGHFAENFPGTKPGKDAPFTGADGAGDFHQAILDEIHAVTEVIFMEHFAVGGKMTFLDDGAQHLQFVAAQIAK